MSPTKSATANEEAANVADSGKEGGGYLAGASTSSLREVHGNMLSWWFRDGQPQSTPFHAQGKQVMPASNTRAVACKKCLLEMIWPSAGWIW